MEKLQSALAKARAERVSRQATTEGRQSASTVPGTPSAVDKAWADLTEFHPDLDTLTRNRIVSQKAGPSASYYDILRTKLRDETRRNGFKRIAITSTRPEAGKSTVSTNLAFALARQSNFRTMIFDFDMRRPTLNKLFGYSPPNDIGKTLRGDYDFADHLVRVGSNLALGLTNGPVANSSELLQSDRAADILSKIEAHYQPDLILFDMPPFLATDDMQGFLPLVDGVLLIVEAQRTTKAQLDAVEQKLSQRTKVIGIVLNKCPFPDETDSGAYGQNYY